MQYTLKIESQDKGKVEISQAYPVTMFYDEFGYLHRYKVKEVFEEAMAKFINATR